MITSELSTVLPCQILLNVKGAQNKIETIIHKMMLRGNALYRIQYNKNVFRDINKEWTVNLSFFSIYCYNYAKDFNIRKI